MPRSGVMSGKAMAPRHPSNEDDRYRRMFDVAPKLSFDSPMRRRQRLARLDAGASASMHTSLSEGNNRHTSKLKYGTPHRRPHSYHVNGFAEKRLSPVQKEHSIDTDLESYPSFSEDSLGSMSTEYASNTVSGLDQFDKRVKELLLQRLI